MIHVERFRDGKWEDLGPLYSATLDVPFSGYHKLRIMDLRGNPETEVDPPWRIIMNGKRIARTGWGGVTRFCNKHLKETYP